LKANTHRTQEPYSPHLFLCHSSADKKFVEKLALDLTELGVRVWLDKWELKAGDSIHGCIEVALSTSAFVGVVVSPDSMTSRWCKEELNAALAREIQSGRKVVLPLFYRSVPLPTFLVDRLYVDFRRRRFPALAELAAFIHDLNKRELATLTSQTRLRSLEDVRSLLLRLGWRNTKRVYLPRKEYETIRKYLRQVGVEITSDEFELLQHRDAYMRTMVIK
jgi:TIR domain